MRAEQLGALDQAMEGVQYVCGTNIRDVTDDQGHIFYKVGLLLE